MVGPNPSVPAAELRPFHLAAEWIAVNHLWEVVAPDVHRFRREKALREERVARREQQELPPARPDFSASKEAWRPTTPPAWIGLYPGGLRAGL